jgi:REP element-mobilizing transposase RayT
MTRRCTQRQLLLRPSDASSSLFLFVLAAAARRFGVEVHAFCVLSSHYHLIVTDTCARLPAFGQYLDSLVARATNSILGRWESFWAPSSYSAVALATPADVLDKTAYVLANPAAAGLVRHGRDWPGLWSAPEQIGAAPLLARRPGEFFRANGAMPDAAELALTVPPGFSSAEEFREQLVAALEVREDQAAKDAAARGGGFMGREKILGQKPTSRPAPFEARRKLNPRVAARDKWKRVEVLARLGEFLADYRAAFSARRAGRLDAIFPHGTYLMRVLHGAPCSSA